MTNKNYLNSFQHATNETLLFVLLLYSQKSRKNTSCIKNTVFLSIKEIFVKYFCDMQVFAINGGKCTSLL